MEDTKKQLLKTIVSRLTKGGVKSIPIVGGILEEAIFGVMDAESARKESAKLQLALQRLQGSIDQQTHSLDALLRTARDQADLSRDARNVVDRVLDKVSSAGAEEEMTAALEAVVARQGIDLSAVPDDVDAMQREIENGLRPDIVDRAALITRIGAMSHADIDVLVATLGAHGIPEKSANRRSRAAKLIEWAQSPDGDGIGTLILTARVLGLPEAIPDPR